MTVRGLVLAGLLTFAAACARAPLDSQPMPQVELARYMGRWYEIARYPNRFEKGCAGVTADYSLRQDGGVDIVNSCRQGGLQGAPRSAKARGWSVDPSNSRFEVSFFRPFKAPYWVAALDPEYRWAVVGHPAREYLWILSRTPVLDAQQERAALAEASRLGYDIRKMERTAQ